MNDHFIVGKKHFSEIQNRGIIPNCHIVKEIPSSDLLGSNCNMPHALLGYEQLSLDSGENSNIKKINPEKLQIYGVEGRDRQMKFEAYI